MYKLKLLKNDFSPLFHVSHCIKQLCATNSANATRKAKAVFIDGYEYISGGNYNELFLLQKAFAEKGLQTIIEY